LQISDVDTDISALLKPLLKNIEFYIKSVTRKSV